MDQDKKVNETFDVLGSKTELVSGNHVEEKHTHTSYVTETQSTSQLDILKTLKQLNKSTYLKENLQEKSR